MDRTFVAEFLGEHSDKVRGSVLEVVDRTYTDRFGGDVVQSCVVDIDTRNTAADIHADIGLEESLPSEAYDCFILTQTLHMIPSPEAALRNAYRALRPAGHLLVTVPAVEPVNTREQDLWRWSPSGFERLLRNTLPAAVVEVRGYGNLVSCIAALHGLVAEELAPEDLRHVDPRFPQVTAALVQKPA